MIKVDRIYIGIIVLLAGFTLAISAQAQDSNVAAQYPQEAEPAFCERPQFHDDHYCVQKRANAASNPEWVMKAVMPFVAAAVMSLVVRTLDKKTAPKYSRY